MQPIKALIASFIKTRSNNRADFDLTLDPYGKKWEFERSQPFFQIISAFLDFV